ncbi:MAG: SpoVA/SpoVAEb family sporulation membrane protein [Oscillospiraceae bacterium]|nr:SpoVA/SpoVAEb family sporulation membrane protein [Oscillospiraceae bacterium]
MTKIIHSQGIREPAPQAYAAMVARASRRTDVIMTGLKAFLIGGSICTVGEVVRQILLQNGLEQDTASAWTSVILVFIAALLTGTGLYQKLAKHGGAGTLVPVTGFANAVAAAAVEAKTEGYVTGIGTKIFTIAGPVILYGTAASVVYGLLYYLWLRF